MINNDSMPGMVKMTALKTRPMPQPVAKGREFWAPEDHAPAYQADGWAALGWKSDEKPSAAAPPPIPRQQDAVPTIEHTDHADA